MDLSFNGTTLATNIDAVMFNGTAVSKVMFNGTEVWAKLVNLTWSGNSTITGPMGIEVSGNLFRARFNAKIGAWITAQSNGTFVGGSSTGLTLTLSVSDNLVRVTWEGKDVAGAWVTYTLANKAFTGTSQSGWYYNGLKNYYYLQTSGGLIRFHQVLNKSSYSGAYISLT